MTLASVERPKTTNKLHNDLEIVRTAMIAELDATSLYEAQIDNLNSEEAKDVIHHIMLEEKEHISELQCLLMMLDKEQEDKMSEVDPSTCLARLSQIDQMQLPEEYRVPPIDLTVTTYELSEKNRLVTQEENPYEWLAAVTHVFHGDTIERVYQIMNAHKDTDSFFKASFGGVFPWKGGEIILKNSEPRII